MWTFNDLINAGKKALDTVKKIGKAAVETAKKVGEVVVDTVKKIGEAIVDTAKKVGEAVVDTAKKVGEVAKFIWGIIVLVSKKTWKSIIYFFKDPLGYIADRTGEFVIDSSVDGRLVSSIPKTRTDAWSFASGIDYENPNERFNLDDTGKYIQYKLDNLGNVTWLINGDTHPNGEFFGENQNSRIKEPTSISYHVYRKGKLSKAPKFDMISSSSDRIIAKEKGTDRFYLAIPSELYMHKTKNGKVITLPQSFFKLDPEINKRQRKLEDIHHHLKVKNDDETHLATNRFPFFRNLYTLLNDEFKETLMDLYFNIYEAMLNSFLKLNIATTIISDNLKKRYFKHFFDQFAVQVPTRVWIEIDVRPFLNGSMLNEVINNLEENFSKEFKQRFDLYNHITYRWEIIFYKLFSIPTNRHKKRRSIDFNHVLDLGVGLSHLNEQYESIYGGEIDSLQNNKTIKIDSDIDNDFLYRMANGPFRDAGGWIDGTCIYYILVQNKKIKEDMLTRSIDTSNNEWKDIYNVLWADEQFAFTERWRSVEIDDNLFNVTFPIYNNIKEKENDFNFTKKTFWSPIEAGNIRPFSRMAIARQIILINGYDFDTKNHEIYSYHLAWGNMDRTWRIRNFPEVEKILGFDFPSKKNKKEKVFPKTICLREDMSIYCKGTKKIIDHSSKPNFINGFWYQKYLPSDNVEQPSASILNEEIKPKVNNKSRREILEVLGTELRQKKYNHPWNFISAAAFTKWHQNFSHFGVLEDVSSRIQFYEIDICDEDKRILWKNLNKPFLDKKNILRIKRATLNWKKAGKILLGSAIDYNKLFFLNLSKKDLTNIGFLPIIEPTNSPPNIYENETRLKFIDAGDLGLIAVHYDKRDDKTIAFDNLRSMNCKNENDVKQKAMEMVLENNENIKIKITLKKRWANHKGFPMPSKTAITPPEVKFVKLKFIKGFSPDSSKVQIHIQSARKVEGVSLFNEGNSPELISYKEWLKINLFRMKCALYHEEEPIKLFDVSIHNEIEISNGNGKIVVEIILSDIQVSALNLNNRLTEFDRINSGHSIWFTGITGLVNIAEKTEFSQRKKIKNKLL